MLGLSTKMDNFFQVKYYPTEFKLIKLLSSIKHSVEELYSPIRQLWPEYINDQFDLHKNVKEPTYYSKRVTAEFDNQASDQSKCG